MDEILDYAKKERKKSQKKTKTQKLSSLCLRRGSFADDDDSIKVTQVTHDLQYSYCTREAKDCVQIDQHEWIESIESINPATDRSS